MRQAIPTLEILEIPTLDAPREALFDRHATLNLINVLVGELTMLGLDLANRPELLDSSILLCHRMADAIRDPARTANWCDAAEPFTDALANELTDLLLTYPHKATDPMVVTGVLDIRESLSTLRKGAAELRRRNGHPRPDEAPEPGAFGDNLLEVLAAARDPDHRSGDTGFHLVA